MEGKLFFSALLAGGMFFVGKVQAQDDPSRPIADIDSKVTRTISDNYKNQFRGYEIGREVVVGSKETITVNRNYKQQTGVNDRGYESSASVRLNPGIVPGQDYKHQFGF